MKRAHRFIGLSVGLFASVALNAVGCDEPPDPVRMLSSDPPVALEDALLYLATEDDTQSVWLLDLQDKARASRKALPEGEAHAFARPGHPGEAVVLTEGAAATLEDGEGKDAVPSQLLLFDRTGETQRFTLSARYAALALSDDGRFAIAYATSGAWSTADNVTIVDLDNADADAPLPATSVRALDGSGPSAVVFAPSDGPRRIAVLVMTDAVNVVDLEHPERHDKVLPLKLPDASANLLATKVLFKGPFCFVQVANRRDVLLIRFEDDQSELGFTAALSTLGTENSVRDIALLESDESAPRLLALLSGGRLATIDVLNGNSETSSTMNDFAMAHVFRGQGPFDDEVRERALLYSKGDGRLGFVDLQRELPGSERGVDLVQLSGGLSDVVFPQSEPLAVVGQNNGTVSLVDLAQRTVSSLTTGAATDRLMLDEREQVANVWVMTMQGGLGVIDLAERKPSQVLLEHAATYVLPLFGDKPRVAVGQSAADGSLLVFEAGEPMRSSAREVKGFDRRGFLK
jgi:hypothetical protein